MPIIQIPPRSVCPHRGVHPKWHGREGIWAVCQMPKPYLINAISMLKHTLNLAWPLKINGELPPLSYEEILQAEDSLRMLEVELQRRLK